MSVSQATRPSGSSARTASRTVSEIWSAILSGCPSVTDSDVKEKERIGMAAGYLADPEEERVARLGARLRAVGDQRAEGAHVAKAGVRREEGQERQRRLQVRVDEAGRPLGQSGRLRGRLEGRVAAELRAGRTERGDALLGRRDHELSADHRVADRDLPQLRKLVLQRRDDLGQDLDRPL